MGDETTHNPAVFEAEPESRTLQFGAGHSWDEEFSDRVRELSNWSMEALLSLVMRHSYNTGLRLEPRSGGLYKLSFDLRSRETGDTIPCRAYGETEQETFVTAVLLIEQEHPRWSREKIRRYVQDLLSYEGTPETNRCESGN